MRGFARYFALILAAIFAVTTLRAAIYMRIKGGYREALVSAGATEIVRREALVNGAEAVLHILAFDEPVEAAVERIRTTCPGFPASKAGRAPDVDGLWISSSGPEEWSDLILMPGVNDAGRCTAWLVERSRTAASLKPMPGENPMPDARLVSWLYDKSGNFLLSVHESAMPPQVAFESAVSSLEHDGWTPASRGETAALMIRNGTSASVVSYHLGNSSRTVIIRSLRQ